MNIKNKKEISIGLSVLIALFCLFFLVNYLKGTNIFHSSNYYIVNYHDVKGLSISAPVTLNGFKVGQVKDVEYDYSNPGNINVELSLTSKLKIPRGSKAVITVDMLGTTSIILKLANDTKFHKIGDTLIGEVESGLMENISTDVVPQINPILEKVDSLLAGLNKLVNDPAMAATVKRLETISTNLDLAIANLRNASKAMPGIMQNVDSTTVNLTALSAKINEFADGLNKLPVDSTMANINAISENLRILSSDLRNPDSSLGMLLHDPDLYNSLNRTIGDLDSLFIDIKKNPKRYINIKLL